ncbi:radical SAM protein [candidate division KSB1 bacterium]|nr:radical SAM protein [candidate division KSB1 bacterium]
MNFPSQISFTITNACNLRCQMCGQWSEHGYVHDRKEKLKHELKIDDWKRLVDQLDDHRIGMLLIRGGEPFMVPGIIDLLEYINNKGYFVSVDTNGTFLKKFAKDIVRIGNMHLTVSVDGSEEIHDRVRGVTGTFKRLKEGLAHLNELKRTSTNHISTSICFTISPYSIESLGDLPDIARNIGVKSMNIVPYCYVTGQQGLEHEKILSEQFGCAAYSWRGFHHEHSGVEFDEFLPKLRKYKATLGELEDYPYLPLTEDEYKDWFADAAIPHGKLRCENPEQLIDIQPNGDANFCVDLPDVIIGNVKEQTIAEIFNGEKANAFRAYRRKQRLPACYRCVAKGMGEIRG